MNEFSYYDATRRPVHLELDYRYDDSRHTPGFVWPKFYSAHPLTRLAHSLVISHSSVLLGALKMNCRAPRRAQTLARALPGQAFSSFLRRT
ncbi:hypothetical protein K443DRAFT_678965 [Laccaria amethystina LaAM-08-1]|uniref:Uncharacterized protein n=1 Tax=Laccaria amethystina LaAM-08-1 TaxID=1095629 RepID=A0A0C9XY28_9AGAR|nr:hypothetical protein K443DRAFT_678965 [Laccaria amethystina LaAM-08-1]